MARELPAQHLVMLALLAEARGHDRAADTKVTVQRKAREDQLRGAGAEKPGNALEEAF